MSTPRHTLSQRTGMDRSAGPPASAMRTLTLLVVAYVVLSLLTVGVIAVVRHDSSQVNATVGTRGVIVAAVSLLTLSITRQVARGSRAAWWRLRVVSAAQIVAIVVIIAIPGSVPAWLKAEQGLYGVLLVAIAVIANTASMRAAVSRSTST